MSLEKLGMLSRGCTLTQYVASSMRQAARRHSSLGAPSLPPTALSTFATVIPNSYVPDLARPEAAQAAMALSSFLLPGADGQRKHMRLAHDELRSVECKWSACTTTGTSNGTRPSLALPSLRDASRVRSTSSSVRSTSYLPASYLPERKNDR